MVTELAWYLEDGRFSTLLTDLRSALEAYAAAKQAGADSDALMATRETARRLFEEQCVSAGLRTAHASYINLDAEFLDGNTLNDIAFNAFIKNLIMAHCYQRVLWTYMGTTASLTVISKVQMAERGLCYEDYLPIAYKAAHPPRQPFADRLNADDELFYVYQDGSVSKTYDAGKARLRFDALQDTSGIDWSVGYDPNATIRKNGWHSAFDNDGVWTCFYERRNAVDAGVIDGAYHIELIRYGGTAILYDPGALLISAEGLIYLTDEDEVYGGLRVAPEATREAIRAALRDMGLSTVSAVASVPDDPQPLEAYRAFLQDLAAPELRVVDRQTLSAARVNAQRNVARYAIPLERLFESAAQTPTADSAYDRILRNMYKAWPYYAASGISKIELARLTSEYVAGNPIPPIEINARIPLEAILCGSPQIAVIAPDSALVDFYDTAMRTQFVEELEAHSVLPGGGALSALALLADLPTEAKPETRHQINAALTYGLGQYEAIAASTGMPIAEVIDAALTVAGADSGTLPDDAPSSGQSDVVIADGAPAPQSGRHTTPPAVLTRLVHYVLPLDRLFHAASQTPPDNRITPAPGTHAPEQTAAPPSAEPLDETDRASSPVARMLTAMNLNLPFNTLTDEEQTTAQTYAASLNPYQINTYNRILRNVYEAWPYYAASGISKTEFARLASEYAAGNPILPTEINVRMPLEAILCGSRQTAVIAPDSALTEGVPVDFYDSAARTQFVEELEVHGVLPGGGAFSALALLADLPLAPPETQRQINAALTHGLGQYDAIAGSTGMPIAEVIRAALVVADAESATMPDDASSGQNDAAIADGAHVTQSGRHIMPLTTTTHTALERLIHYSLPIERLFRAASQTPPESHVTPASIIHAPARSVAPLREGSAYAASPALSDSRVLPAPRSLASEPDAHVALPVSMLEQRPTAQEVGHAVTAIALSEEEAIKQTYAASLNPSPQNTYNHILRNVYEAWPHYASSGISKTELARLASEYAVGNPIPPTVVHASAPLETIFNAAYHDSFPASTEAASVTPESTLRFPPRDEAALSHTSAERPSSAPGYIRLTPSYMSMDALPPARRANPGTLATIHTAHIPARKFGASAAQPPFPQAPARPPDAWNPATAPLPLVAGIAPDTPPLSSTSPLPPSAAMVSDTALPPSAGTASDAWWPAIGAQSQYPASPSTPAPYSPLVPMVSDTPSPLYSPPTLGAVDSPLAARTERDAELARLRRIEANYERDKALLAREKPALARRDTHDVGNADADEQTDSPEKLAARLYHDIVEAIKRDA
jgi:hypothetical protein